MATAGVNSRHNRPAPYWTQPWAWLMVALVAAGPFAVTALPPLMDLPGHMARYHIMRDLGTSPDLQRYYSFQWMLLGNLGVDLLVYGLKGILSVAQATWAACLLSVLLSVAAIYRLSRAAHGTVQPTALLALPFVYSHIFQYGFLNFALSLPLALLALSFWLTRPDRPRRNAAIFGATALLLWLCHMVGWGIFALCAGLAALQQMSTRHAGKPWPVLRDTARAVWPLALPLVLILALRTDGSGAPTTYAREAVWEKAVFLLKALRDQSFALDLASIAVLALVPLMLLWRRHVQVSAPLLAAAAGLGLVYIVMPSQVFGSFYADTRLIAPVAILALVALRWSRPQQGAHILAAGALALFALRIGFTTAGWAAADARVRSHLKAIDFIARGSRVLAIVVQPCSAGRGSVDFSRNHLAEMAVLRKDVFINSMWQVPGAQALRVIYNQDTRFGQDPSQYVRPPECAASPAATLAGVLADMPRDRFDYLWIMNPPAGRGAAMLGLVPLYADARSALYRIARKP